MSRRAHLSWWLKSSTYRPSVTRRRAPIYRMFTSNFCGRSTLITTANLLKVKAQQICFCHCAISYCYIQITPQVESIRNVKCFSKQTNAQVFFLKPVPMGCRKYVSRGMVCPRAGMKGQSTVSPPPWWTLRKRLEIFKIPQFTLLAITPTTFQGIPWPSDNSQIDKYQDFVLCFASKRRCLLICKQNFYFCQRAFFSINWKTGNGKNSS